MTKNYQLFLCVEPNTDMEKYIQRLALAPSVKDSAFLVGDNLKGKPVIYYQLIFGENGVAMDVMARTLMILIKLRHIKGKLYKMTGAGKNVTMNDFIARCSK